MTLLFLIITTSCNPYDPSLSNEETEWSNSFECNSIENCIQNTHQKGEYKKYLPAGPNWTYSTTMPNGAELKLNHLNASDNKYLSCYVPSKVNIITRKAQIVRKFPPYGIMEGYDGLTAIHCGDKVTINVQLFINSANLYDGKVYFLDIEDSTKGNVGFRYFIYNNNVIGISLDKIKINKNVIYEKAVIPTNEWFSFKTEILISENGYYKIWINNKIVLDRDGLSFLNRLNFYDAVMTGITGTLINHEYSILVDDFLIKVERKKTDKNFLRITADIFNQYKEEGEKMGFRYVASAPFVRISFYAEEALKHINRKT